MDLQLWTRSPLGFFYIHSAALREQEVAQSFGIQSLPTFQIWRGGQKVAETIGATQNLEGWLEQHSSPIPSMEPFKGSGRTLAGTPQSHVCDCTASSSMGGMNAVLAAYACLKSIAAGT